MSSATGGIRALVAFELLTPWGGSSNHYVHLACYNCLVTHGLVKCIRQHFESVPSHIIIVHYHTSTYLPKPSYLSSLSHRSIRLYRTALPSKMTSNFQQSQIQPNEGARFDYNKVSVHKMPRLEIMKGLQCTDGEYEAMYAIARRWVSSAPYHHFTSKAAQEDKDATASDIEARFPQIFARVPRGTVFADVVAKAIVSLAIGGRRRRRVAQIVGAPDPATDGFVTVFRASTPTVNTPITPQATPNQVSQPTINEAQEEQHHYFIDEDGEHPRMIVPVYLWNEIPECEYPILVWSRNRTIARTYDVEAIVRAGGDDYAPNHLPNFSRGFSSIACTFEPMTLVKFKLVLWDDGIIIDEKNEVVIATEGEHDGGMVISNDRQLREYMRLCYRTYQLTGANFVVGLASEAEGGTAGGEMELDEGSIPPY